MTEVVRQDCLAAAAAHVAVKTAVEAGRAIGCAMAAAAVDAGGNLIAFLRDNGAYLSSGSVAEDKAFTAASFGVSTLDLANRVDGNARVREAMAHRDRVVLLNGGLPIRVEGRLVGGIGVSGGTGEQDAECARAALAAIGADAG